MNDLHIYSNLVKNLVNIERTQDGNTMWGNQNHS